MNRRRPLRTIYTDKVNDIKKILLAVRSDPMSYVPNPTKYNPCVMSTEGCKYDPYEPSMCVMPFMFHASLTRTASACARAVCPMRTPFRCFHLLGSLVSPSARRGTADARADCSNHVAGGATEGSSHLGR